MRYVAIVTLALGLVIASTSWAHGPVIPPVIVVPPGGTGTAGIFSPSGVGTPLPAPVAAPGRQTGGPTGGSTGGTRPGPTGGGSTGLAMGGPVPRGATTPGGRKKATSLEGAIGWESWWMLNHERFYRRPRVQTGDGQTPNQDLDMGLEHANGRSEAQLERLRELAVRYLRRGVRDADPDVRAASVIALAKCGRPASLADVRAELLQDTMGVREYAVLSLGLLDDPAAVRPLVAIAKGTPEARKLLGLTSDPSREVRVIATLGLGLAGNHGQTAGREGIPTLIELMTEKGPNDDVNIAAALALGMLEAKEAVPALLTVLEDDEGNAYIRANAAAALGRIGDRGAMPALTKALRSSDAHVRRSACVALGNLATPADADTVDALITAARSGADRAKKNFAVIALGEIGGADARNFLYRMLQKGDVYEKSFAALALGVHGFKHEDDADQEIAELLGTELSRTRSPELQGALVVALGLLGDRSAAADVAAIAGSKGKDRVRTHAALALGLMQSTESIGTLREVLSTSTHRGLRVSAATALGLLNDQEAVTILKGLMFNESNVALRGASMKGLGLIGGVEVVGDLGRVLVDAELGYPDETRTFAAAALGYLADKDERPAMTRIHEGINYTSQRGVLSRLLGGI